MPPAPLLRSVVLCADDFGLSEGVSRGILELARGRRISATGVMTTHADWGPHGSALAGLRGEIGIGLHLDLTSGAPLGPMPQLSRDGRAPDLGRLIGLALAGRLPAHELAAEIDRQLDAFAAAFGGAPDFVDGHQHVHALPGIRGVLIERLRRRGLAGRLWLRDPADAHASILRRRLAAGKALTVAMLAGGFGRAARQAGFATNRGFSGFSPFDPGLDPQAAFARFLVGLADQPVVMCHPGHVDAALRGREPVVETRPRELAFLASAAFDALLSRHGVTLAPRP